MGYASALAWLLFLIIAIVTAVQIVLSRRFVYYEGER
jgi:multiple sugar transport system permease protein